MRKYLTIAKQVAKERITKQQDNSNSTEVDSEREHFMILKEGYAKIHHSGDSLYNDHWPTYNAHNDTFNNSLLAFSASIKDSSLTSTNTMVIAETLKYVGEGLQQENKIAAYCVESARCGFLDTTQKICEVHLKDVHDLRNKQEIARLQLSHSVGQLKSMQKKASVISNKDAISVASKLQQAEEENRIAQEEYDKATGLFIEGMEHLENISRDSFVSSLNSLVEAHIRSMEDGIAMWKDVLANLEKLQQENSSLNPTPKTSRTPTPTPTPTTPTSASSSTPPSYLVNGNFLEPSLDRDDGNDAHFARRNSSPTEPPASILQRNLAAPVSSFLRRNSSPKPYIPPVEPVTTSISTSATITTITSTNTNTNTNHSTPMQHPSSTTTIMSFTTSHEINGSPPLHNSSPGIAEQFSPELFPPNPIMIPSSSHSSSPSHSPSPNFNSVSPAPPLGSTSNGTLLGDSQDIYEELVL